MDSSIVKSFREKLNLTQKQFAETYEIPLSTLTKWEQCESKPPKYVLLLLSKVINMETEADRKIKTKNNIYYIFTKTHSISDKLGNEIKYKNDLNNCSDNNLSIFLDSLFESFYRIQNGFDSSVKYAGENSIVWQKL